MRKSNDDQINATLAGLNHEVDIVTVDNPLATIKGVKSDAIRSLRKDPLAALHSRSQIDDAQMAAGRKWQYYHEKIEIGGARAIDTTKEAVDGGRFPEPDLDGRDEAGRELKRAKMALAKVEECDGQYIIDKILGEGKTIQQMSTGLGLCSEWEFRKMGQRFRECLETLAKLWGFA